MSNETKYLALQTKDYKWKNLLYKGDNHSNHKVKIHYTRLIIKKTGTDK